MPVRRKILLICPLIAGLAACASAETRYPSLAMRPFETAPPAPAPAPEVEPIRPLADAAMLADLVARATASHADFTRQQPQAARMARSAAGLPVESNTRAAALVAMADLAAARGTTATALADLDQLAVDSATTFAPADDIEAARRTVLALVAEQDAAIARLWKELGQ